MSVCTFFGHRGCYGLDGAVLRNAMEELIQKGVDDFLVGNQGQFDRMVYGCLKSLQIQYPHIRYSVVLAYLPAEKKPFEDYSDTVFPCGMEQVHPKYAVERRNRWMITRSQYCLCYINHTWGGAYKFARMASRRGLSVINLGSTEFIIDHS